MIPSRLSDSLRAAMCPVLGLAGACTALVAEVPTTTGNRRLAPIEQVAIIERSMAGFKTVVVVLGARPGRAAQLADQLHGRGAESVWVDSDVDFVRAAVRCDQILEVINLPDVAVAQVETFDDNQFEGLSPESRPSGLTAVPPSAPPSRDTPADNPYTAERATEAYQFKQANPTFDGRGVVIGGHEPVDALSPSMQRALSLDGRPVPKFKDYYFVPPFSIVRDAVPDAKLAGSFGWQKTQEAKPADGHIGFNGKSYVVPADATGGEWRISLWRSRLTAPWSELTLLWEMPTARVWVCNQDEAGFRPGLSLTALPSGSLQAATLSLPSPDANGVHATLLVSVDREQRAIAVQIGGQDHGMATAGVAVGHNYLGSQAGGVAPQAQWLTVMGYAGVEDTRNFPANGLKSTIQLFRDPRVDLITNSGQMPRDSERGFRQPQENTVYGQFFQRLTARFPKLYFIAAGNDGPAASFDSAIKFSDHTISVGAYTPLECWEAIFGITPSHPMTMAPYSAYGPREDGALKPDLVSSTGTWSLGRSNQPAPLWPLPPGTMISGGTSCSTPNAAAHAALLLSAARQQKIPCDAARVKLALLGTCRFLDETEARVQGHGLIQVSQAWAALQRLKSYALSEFETIAPVRTPWSGQFARPNSGAGLYETGWHPNEAGERELTITRRRGPPGSPVYQLRWHESGPDGTNEPAHAFSSPMSEVRLPLDQPVRIPVQVKVGRSGAYSAILDLVDPSVDLAVHSVMCTVLAAEPLDAAHGYSCRVQRAAPRPGYGFGFVEVPEGTTALRLRVESPSGQLLGLYARTPAGQQPRQEFGRLPGSHYDKWYLGRAALRSHYDQTFAQPMAGTWQFWVSAYADGGIPAFFEPEESRPALRRNFSLEATAIGATGSVVGTVSSSNPARVAFTNRLANLAAARISPLGMGARREESFHLSDELAYRRFDIEVAAGTAKLAIDAATDGADSSLLLYRLSDEGRTFKLVACDLSEGSAKSLSLRHPDSGHYVAWVAVRGRIPLGGSSVRYSDTLFDPHYGTLTCTDTATALATGATKEADVFCERGASVPGERQLVAEVALLEQGCVNIGVSEMEKFFNASWGARSLLLPGFVEDPVPVGTVLIEVADHPRTEGSGEAGS